MYSSDKNVNIVVSRLRYDFAVISESFCEIYVVLNACRWPFLTVVFNGPFPGFSFNDATIENVTDEKILRIAIDNNLRSFAV